MSTPAQPLKWKKLFSYTTLNGAQTNHTLLAPTTGKRLLIHDIWFSVDTAGLYKVSRGNNSASNNIVVARLGANASAIKSWSNPDNALLLDTNETVKTTHAVAGNIYVTIEYSEVD